MCAIDPREYDLLPLYSAWTVVVGVMVAICVVSFQNCTIVMAGSSGDIVTEK